MPRLARRVQLLPNMNAQTKLEAAYAAIQSAEARGVAQKTLNKYWKAYFLAEDEAKQGGWGR